MAKFKVIVKRTETLYTEAEVQINAESAEAARQEVEETLANADRTDWNFDWVETDCIESPPEVHEVQPIEGDS